MRREDTELTLIDTYDSTDELAAVWLDKVKPFQEINDWSSMRDDPRELIRDGWADGVEMATPIYEHALQYLHEHTDVPSFQATWQVAGSEVDIGRYVQGLPECMIEHEPIRVSRVGRVVQLRVGVFYSSAISTRNMVKRGAAVVGLAMALEECQHSVEIWLDLCTFPIGQYNHDRRNYDSDSQPRAIIRTLVKDAADSIDPARLAYWLAHPSVTRLIHFEAMDNFPPKWQKLMGSGGSSGGHGMKGNPIDLPEEAIYLPQTSSLDDIPSPDTFIVESLRKLGLVD